MTGAPDDPSSLTGGVELEDLHLKAIDSLFESLAGGASFAEVQRTQLPTAWSPVLARTAVAGPFDRPIFEQLLSPEPAPELPSLDTLVATEVLEPVRGRPGWYALPEQSRALWSAQLGDDDLAELQAGLAQEHLRRGASLEALRHLLAADPDAGQRLMDELFTTADQQLDLPRCRDVLRVADDDGSLGSQVAATVAGHRAYLNARSMWLRDLSQSAQFLPPEGLEAAADDLREGRTRAWEISGQGGGGKTMQLRWLISRRWVPRPDSLSCALIDFDTVDPMVIARHPFLVLVLAADQLGRQLPRNPFSTLLRSYAPLLDVARRSGEGSDIDPQQSAVAAQDVPRLFAGCLQASPSPVVLVLDTLEELSQRYPTQTAQLVDLLADVSDRAPTLRLVFSGRFVIPRIRERLPAAVALPVLLFDDERAATYLRDVRRITDVDRCTQIVRRSRGLPFLLALYADLVTGDPEVVLDALDAGRAPQLVYLVERVVDRIPQPLVRWLLRYGSVGRRLSKAYLLEVIAPFLVRIASGAGDLDDPMIDPITQWRGRPLFPTDLPDLREALEGAWQELQSYVSGSSWVFAAHDEPDTLVFKAEVRGPMREVLARQQVWLLLHQESARFYVNLAAGSPAPERWLREALFHTAHAGGALEPLWRGAVDAAREAGRYGAIIDLGAEIAGSEYLDDDGQPLHQRDGTALVPTDLLVEAHLWRAYAAQALASRRRLSLDDPGWREVARELNVATTIAQLPLDTWVSGLAVHERQPLLRAARLLCSAAAERRWQPIDWTHAHTDAAPETRLSAAWLQVALGHNGEIENLTQVRQIAGALSRLPDLVSATLQLVDLLAERGQVQVALRLLHMTSDNVPADTSLQRRLLRLLVTAGRPGEAVRLHLSGVGLDRIAAQRLVARALIATRRPVEALDLIDECEHELRGLETTDSERLREQAECLQVRGIASGELLRLDESLQAFEEASSLWSELGHPHGHLRSRLEHSEMLLRQYGDVEATVTQLRSLGSQLDGSWTSDQIRLLLAQAVFRAGEGPRGADILQQVLNRLHPEHHPRRALACVIGLIVTGDLANFGPPLLDALEHITPVSARLPVLAQLRWLAAPLPAGDIGSSLLNLITKDSDEDQSSALQAAYVASALGERDRAAALVAAGLDGRGPDFATWEAIRHLGAGVAPLRSSADFGWASPIARAALDVRRAELAWKGVRGDVTEAERLLQRAWTVLKTDFRPNRVQVYALVAQAELAYACGEETRARALADDAKSRYSRLGDASAAVSVGENRRPLVPDSLATSPGSREPDALASLDEYVVRPDQWDWDGADPADIGSAAVLARMEVERRAVQESGARVVRVQAAHPALLALPWTQLGEHVYLAQPAAGTRYRDLAWLRSIGPKGRLVSSVRHRAENQLEENGLDLPERLQLEEAHRRAGGHRVTIVQAERKAEQSWGYGHSDSGLDLADSYRRAGWSVAELSSLADPHEVAQTLLKQRPSLIHLTGRLEMSASLAWFDLSEENRRLRGQNKSRGETRGIFPRDLGQWLEPWRRGLELPPSAPPVFLLDPVAPPTLTDRALEQARNRFAAEVYLDCPVLAVVAAGLTRDPYRAQRTWLDATDAGSALLNTVHQMRRVSVDDAATPTLFAPSATFSLPQR